MLSADHHDAVVELCFIACRIFLLALCGRQCARSKRFETNSSRYACDTPPERPEQRHGDAATDQDPVAHGSQSDRELMPSTRIERRGAPWNQPSLPACYAGQLRSSPPCLTGATWYRRKKADLLKHRLNEV